ncbi:DEAD/DEAH box helicase family protein [Streptomyces sp. NPDC006288]|uniref:DEAD/DEAH box helicase family protein n=1 Tax=Streptomyces sp. NPDC006288 TaxID=3156743 RepID=UPI0033A4048E
MLRPHQVKGRDAAARHLRRPGTRGLFVSATGTGKTLVAIRLVDLLELRLVLVVVPTLDLAAQTALAWRADGHHEHMVIVSSMDTHGHEQLYANRVGSTSNAAALAAAMSVVGPGKDQLPALTQVEPVDAGRIRFHRSGVRVGIQGCVCGAVGGAAVSGVCVGPAGAGVEHGGHAGGADARCLGQGRFDEVDRAARVAGGVLLDGPERERVRADDRIVRARSGPQGGDVVALRGSDPAAVVGRPPGRPGCLGSGTEQTAPDALAVGGVPESTENEAHVLCL